MRVLSQNLIQNEQTAKRQQDFAHNCAKIGIRSDRKKYGF
jgi:hypothetical protein